MDEALPPQPCPKCSATLAYVRREGQLLEVCTACRGVWFDPGELTLLIEVYRKLDDRGGTPSGTACPRCRAELVELPFPGTQVLVDRCPGCQGIWLDGGELEALKAALRDVAARADDSGEEPVVGRRALALIADAELAAARRAVCPKCKAGLWYLRRDGNTIEQCSACGGMWLDAGELTAAIAVYRRVDSRHGTPTGASCLRDAEELREVVFPGTQVLIDVCPACAGVWLDRGELDALRAAVQHLVAPERDLNERARELALDAPAPEARGCPRCGGDLAPDPLRGVAVERCAGCGGTWLDAGLLSICLGVSRKLRVRDGQETARLCVRCPRQPLVELTYPGTEVTLDLCPDCRSTWLDAGRLEALVQATPGAPA
ncbi:MAG: zf-TFIIB domain-containing protein [Planctomycetes bacterium]|nr:zf-TFIIB domain-containing protein [Planctomycetota bacterium]